jgi:hypothetical protein
MSIQLILTNDDLNEDSLQLLTQDLLQTLGSETDIQAEIVQGEAVQGSKGDPVTLGVLALSFITSGAAVALIGVLKSYLIRDSSMQFEFISHDKVVKINAKNLHADQIEQVISSVKQLIDSETHD